MKSSKLLRAATAAVTAIVMCVTTAGCSVELGTSPEAQAKKVVARPTGGENTEGMEITFGEFNKQYNYILKLYEIEDDKAEDVAEACREQRQQIIENLVTNEIILHKAKELGVDELTPEELEEAKKTTDEQIEQQIQYFSGLASYSDLGLEEITDEVRHQRGSEKLDEFLASCDMTRDDLLTWTKEYIISSKVLDEVTKDITREDAEARANEYISRVETMYKNDTLMYEQYGYTELWLPEGSRLIKHVLLGFDESLQTQITVYRNNNDTEGANKLREEGAKELEAKVTEVQQKLDEMDEGKISFNDILLAYSADATGSSAYPDGYIVVPNGVGYMPEFQEAAFVPEKIGDRTTCVTDYGVHIMIYAGDAKVSEDAINSFVETALGEMRNEEFNNKLAEWKTTYNYEIHRELLRLDEEISTSDSSANSDGADSTDSSANSSTTDESGSSTTE